MLVKYAGETKEEKLKKFQDAFPKTLIDMHHKTKGYIMKSKNFNTFKKLRSQPPNEYIPVDQCAKIHRDQCDLDFETLYEEEDKEPASETRFPDLKLWCIINKICKNYTTGIFKIKKIYET